MPPPPSDEELIASFTPREHEFWTWQKANAQLLSSLNTHRAAKNQLLQETWPNDSNVVEEYASWQHKWFGRHYLRKTYEMTDADFFNALKNTNFMDRNSLASFSWQMEMYNLPPLILLGESLFGGIFAGYALMPGSWSLWPHYDMSPKDPFVLPQTVMGINLNVHIHQTPSSYLSDLSPRRHPREQDRISGRETVRSAELGDAETSGGFTFVQIGVLYTIASGWEEQRTKTPDEIIEQAWQATGFSIVVELDVHGNLGPIWAIYGFHSQDDDSNEFVHVSSTDRFGKFLPHVGRLTTGSSEIFTVAKIAGSIEELQRGHTRLFDFDVASREECQIVRAMIYEMSNGRWLLRQFVKSDS